MSTEVKRLKKNFEVTLGEKYVGTFETLQKAKTAAEVANTVATILGKQGPVVINEVVSNGQAEVEEKAA